MSTKLVIATIALLTALAAPALAAGGAHAKPHRARVVAPSFGNAHNAVGDFTGYPTDFLNSRFGDFQAQGRL